MGADVNRQEGCLHSRASQLIRPIPLWWGIEQRTLSTHPLAFQPYSDTEYPCRLINVRSENHVFNGKSKRIDEDDVVGFASTYLCTHDYFPELGINLATSVIGSLNQIIRA